MTLFEVVYGMVFPKLTRFLSGETKFETMRKKLVDRDECLRQLKFHLNWARTCIKNQVDQHRTDTKCVIGD